MDTQEKKMTTSTHGANTASEHSVQESRRAFVKKAGRFAVLIPPTMMMLSSPTSAGMLRSVVAGPRGNNGLGNGVDLQPPGNPPVNDGTGTGPGNPGNRGGPV